MKKITKLNFKPIKIIYHILMFIPVLLLLTIGASSYIYSSYVMPFISNIVSVETQSMILIFSCILLLLDNFTLLHDLQNIKLL